MFLRIYSFFVRDTLYEFYKYLPSYYGIGGWGGKKEEEICYVITGVEKEHWENPARDLCLELIDKHFTSLLILTYSCFKIYITFKVTSSIICVLIPDIFFRYLRNDRDNCRDG